MHLPLSSTPGRGQLPGALSLLGLLSGCVLPVTSFVPTSNIIAADSSADHRALLEAAWADQIAFEKFRLQNLPRLYGPFPERPACREVIGRFCLNPGDGFGMWHYLPEPPTIATYRADLISALRDIAQRIPADNWVAGQRVRYAVEAGDFEEARKAALDCAGEDWWCAALIGYALHRGGQAGEAARAFETAAAALRPEERQRWLDPSPLLDPEARTALVALPLSQQIRFADRFWQLADPFFSRPGNEILAEHLARRVEIQFQYAAGFLEGVPWDDDLDQVLLRYGAPESRIRGMGALFKFWWIDRLVEFYLGPPFQAADLISHYRMPALELLPPVEDLDPGRGVWDRPDRNPRAGYRLSLGDSSLSWLPQLTHQVAIFRRNDAAVVIADFDLTAHGLPADTRVDAGIGLLPLDPVLPLPASVNRSGSNASGPLIIAVEPRPALMSLEVTAPAHGQAARARYLLDIQPFSGGSPRLSDILLFDPGDVAPDSLQDALPLMRGSTRVQPGDELGLFWEMYGLDPAREATVDMSLRIVTESPGILGRIGRILGITPSGNPTRITWEEETEPGPIMSRDIVLTVPELPGGTHTIELTMSVGDQPPIVVGRQITIGEAVVRPLPDGEVTRRPILARTLCGVLAEEGLVVGNLGNLEATLPMREAELAREVFAQSWMYPPVDAPGSFRCPDWVRMNPEYFGHGPQFW